MVMVGDRGMITTARIDALQASSAGMGWLTALRAPADRQPWPPTTGPLQMTLFDDHDFAEITHPDYPGERLVCCRNPALAAERARKRGDLLAATEPLLAPIAAAVAAGRLVGADEIGLKVGKVVATGTRWQSTSPSPSPTPPSPSPASTTSIDAEAALDGIYVHPHQRARRPTWTPPRWSPPTRTSPCRPSAAG